MLKNNKQLEDTEAKKKEEKEEDEDWDLDAETTIDYKKDESYKFFV